jgi:hypothetical protein
MACMEVQRRSTWQGGHEGSEKAQAPPGQGLPASTVCDPGHEGLEGSEEPRSLGPSLTIIYPMGQGTQVLGLHLAESKLLSSYEKNQ